MSRVTVCQKTEEAGEQSERVSERVRGESESVIFDSCIRLIKSQLIS